MLNLSELFIQVREAILNERQFIERRLTRLQSDLDDTYYDDGQSQSSVETKVRALTDPVRSVTGDLSISGVSLPARHGKRLSNL